jgi:hypothetical protein
MKTTCHSIRLQSGQGFALDRHGCANLFLTEGEVLLQASAEWIGETVILAPPRRVAAPAALTYGRSHSLTALGAAKIRVEEPASPLEKLKSAWNALRFAWQTAVA